MLLSLFIFLTGFSGVLLSYMLGNKKLNRAIPLSFMSIVTVLFVFGLIDHLKIGAIVVDLLILAIYLSFVIWLVVHRKDFWTHMKTIFPSMIIWGIVFLILNYSDVGMMTHNWDEFSHWADTVKIMTYLDDFATGKNSPALFKSYPPAMSLLQYFFQKNKMWLKGDDLFTDWRLYLSYHAFSVSFLFPCFDKEEKAYRKIIKVLILILVSVLFYADLPESLCIDPFVALLGGYAILLSILNDRKDMFNLLSVSLACFCLTLSKEIGIYFSIVVGIIYLLECIEYSVKNFFSVKGLYGFIPLLSGVVAKLLWKWELFRNNLVSSRGMHIDFAEYFNMVFLKNGKDYKQEVVTNSLCAFFENRVNFGLFTTSYFWILVICLILLVVSCTRYVKQGEFDKKKSFYIILALVLMTIIYTLFIGAVYAYNFTEYEARGLASYERYMNMPFLILSLVAVGLFLNSIDQSIKDNNILACVALAIGLVFGLNGTVYKWVSRSDVESSKIIELGYRNVRSTIWGYCEPDDRIYFVSIADRGLDHLAAGYYVRPYSFLNLSWSLGKPYFEEDIWSRDISPDEWMETLVESCDYVYIHNVRDEFIQEYEECFTDPSSIEFGSLYKVDAENRVLVRVN